MVALDWTGLLRLPVAPNAAEASKDPGCVAPLRATTVEPCGRAYHIKQFVPRKRGSSVLCEEDSDESEAEVREALREKLDRKGLDLEDYYALMGLDELGWKSTVEQINQQWKMISFICHPDKSTPETRPYAEKRFKAMQLAYSTLTDKQKRIGYDSALPFDEAIPKESEGTTEATFYKVYAPVFERNARFSSAPKPAPELGDSSSSYDYINGFYDYWLGFKSWRDFTYLDEHKNDDGTDRFTRRENDRKNQKLRAGKKREETARVRKLVEDAMKKDPRMKRQKEEAALEQKRRKEEIKEKKRRAKQEAEDKANAEAKAIEDAKAAEKAAKDAVKKKASGRNKMLKKLRRLVNSGRAGTYEQKQLEVVMAGATYEQLEELIAAMALHMDGPNPPPLSEEEVVAAKTLFRACLRSLQTDEENAAADALEAEAERKRLEELKAQAAKEQRHWTEEEVAVLEKAVVKHLRDWPVQTDLVNDVSPFTRSKKEVIHKAKEIMDRQAAEKKEKEDKAAAAVAVAEEETKTPAASAAPAATATEKAPQANAGPADQWTSAQQKALEAALKKVGKDTPKRFEVIAPMVPGKTKMQCVQRFKLLRAQAKASGGRDWVWGHDWDAISCFPGSVQTEWEKESLAKGPPAISNWL